MSISKHLSESISEVSGSFNEQINESKKGGKNSFSMSDIKTLLKGDSVFIDSENPKFVDDILFNGGGSFSERSIYCGGKYHIRKYNGSIQITELSNAMKRGKFIKQYVIHNRLGDDGDFMVALANYCNNFKKGFTLEELLKYTVRPMIDNQEELVIGTNGESAAMMEKGSVTIGFYLKDDWTKGVKFADPYKIPSLKPITKFPNKWRLADLIKVIANGQYILLTRDYKYTDDYAYDAAYGGLIKYLNPIKMVIDMIENPEFFKSIWITSPISGTEGDDNKVTVHFGMSNTSYTICVSLDELTTPKDILKLEKK